MIKRVQTIRRDVFVVVAFMFFVSVGSAEASKEMTVEQAYPGFASGILKGAKMVELKKRILLVSEGIEIKEKLNVVFVHVGEQQILASRYGIQSIPVQVFFDRDGKEVFRHVGFYAEAEVLKKLKTLGVE